MTTVQAQESAPDLNEGIYEGEFTGYEISQAGEYGPSVKLIWTLPKEIDREGKVREKWLFASLKLTPKSNLWRILKAMGTTPILGQNYEIEDILDPLVGNVRANLVVKHVEGAKGTSAKITDILPLSDARAAAAAELCGVPGCGKPYARFSPLGIPLCEAHGAQQDA